MKKYSIRLVRENINFDDINLDNIECTGKTLFNIMMTILLGGSSIGILILSSEMLHSIQGVLAYIIINSIFFILPFAYLILKTKNYYFSIENDKIMYKNTFGITYKYKIYEIKNIKYITSHHIKIFIIKMENGKIIIISNYSTNFKLLKLRFQKEKLIL